MSHQYYFQLIFFDSTQKISTSEIETHDFVLTVIYQLISPPDLFQPFSAWCSLKGNRYLNKSVAESCKFAYVWTFTGNQELKS